jgi:hypothetical protein
MPKDALDHVHVDVLLAEQRPGCVTGVVKPCVLGDARRCE